MWLLLGASGPTPTRREWEMPAGDRLTHALALASTFDVHVFGNPQPQFLQPHGNGGGVLGFGMEQLQVIERPIKRGVSLPSALKRASPGGLPGPE